MLPLLYRIETDACYLMGRKIETDACYPRGGRKETDSLHPNPIYRNNFLKAYLKILIFPTIFISYGLKQGMFSTWHLFKIRTQRIMGNFVHMGFHVSSFQHLGLIALGHFITLTVCTGTLCSIIPKHSPLKARL
jgi:hypothetical protein